MMMQKTKTLTLCVAAAAALLMAGCASKVPLADDKGGVPIESRTGTTPGAARISSLMSEVVSG